MRISYYIAYNPIIRRYVGVVKRAYKEKLEFLAAQYSYSKGNLDFVGEGEVYDVDFSDKVLPLLIKAFNNRLGVVKHYSTDYGSGAFFKIPERVAQQFPENFKGFRYLVAVFPDDSIVDLRDADELHLFDNEKDAIEAYAGVVEVLKLNEAQKKRKDKKDSDKGNPKEAAELLVKKKRSTVKLPSSWDFLL
jgi:hypothetical protein